MSKFLLTAYIALLAGPAFAPPPLLVPEIDGLSGLTAMAAIAGVVAFVWERRRS
jgi:hypothetical protein